MIYFVSIFFISFITTNFIATIKKKLFSKISDIENKKLIKINKFMIIRYEYLIFKLRIRIF